MDISGIVLIRGGGDLATGIAHRLINCGFTVVISEIANPTVIRRTVAFAAAVNAGVTVVEGIAAKHVSLDDASALLKSGVTPVLTEDYADILHYFEPWAVVDAIIAKRNLGTKMTDARITVGVGPGFQAGIDVHAVVETMRGHDLGKVIPCGAAIPDTGIPGEIEGYTLERLIKAPCSGIVSVKIGIGNMVKKGDRVAYIGCMPVEATMNGILRGMIHDGQEVLQGMKVGDIDPRCKREHCFTISDKARAVAGGVVEALLSMR